MEQQNKVKLNIIITSVLIVLTAALFITFKAHSDSYKPAETDQRITRHTFSFDPEVLIYDGKGELNLLEGVLASSSDGTDCTERITAEIKQTDSISDKIIIYKIYNPDMSFTSSDRKLHLENYSGPSISFSGAGIKLLSDDENLILSELLNQNLIRADDGYGKDISKKARVSVISKDSSGKCSIVISVENFLGDTASVHSSVTVS